MRWPAYLLVPGCVPQDASALDAFLFELLCSAVVHESRCTVLWRLRYCRERSASLLVVQYICIENVRVFGSVYLCVKHQLGSLVHNMVLGYFNVCLLLQALGAYYVSQYHVASPCAMLADCTILYGTGPGLAHNNTVFAGQIEVRGAALCCLSRMNQC